MPRVILFLPIVLWLAIQPCAAREPGSFWSEIRIKPYLSSFTQMRVDLHNDTVLFRQEKVIFGINIRLNENWNARIGIDLINMNRPYLKPTSLTWQKDRWTVDAGIFTPSQMDMASSFFWNNRFIERVAADKWVRDPTADLGLRVAYRWNDFLTTDVSLVSGNGYQRLTEKYHPMPAFRFVLSPLKPLKLSGYVATHKSDDVYTTSYSGFIHFEEERWKITGEYFHKTNFRFEEDMKLNVTSFYSTVHLTSWLSILARYDLIRSHKTGSFDRNPDDGEMFIGGAIFRCFPSVRLSLNYCNRRPDYEEINKEDWLYVCVEFKY